MSVKEEIKRCPYLKGMSGEKIMYACKGREKKGCVCVGKGCQVKKIRYVLKQGINT